jgi:hypothetical protein
MKPKTPQPKSRPLSRNSSAAGALALGFNLNMDMGVGNQDDDLNELDDVNENVKKISKKKANSATAKSFGPIPRISPSAFIPLLPSSLPESTIESAEGDGDGAPKHAIDRNEEDDSIEQFESPNKKDMGSTLGGERRIGILNVTSRQERGKHRAKESASDIWNSDLNRRGQELAEAARKREKERLRAEEKSALAVSTSTKSVPQAKHAAFRYIVTEKLNRLPALEEEELNSGVSMQSLLPDVVLPPHNTKSVAQQMEDAYVDLSGGVREDQNPDPVTVGASTRAGIEGSQSVEAEHMVDNNFDMDTEMNQQPDTMHLRQEEEESTQDLMMELRLRQQQQESGVARNGAVPEAINDTEDLPPAVEIDSQPIGEVPPEEGAQECNANEQSDHFLDEIPSVCIIFAFYQNVILLMPVLDYR